LNCGEGTFEITRIVGEEEEEVEARKGVIMYFIG
jgi:hypothetical protein